MVMLLKELSEGVQRKAVLGMKSFYKAVIKDMQTKLTLNDEHLLALSYLGPKMKKTPTSLHCCKILAHGMPSVAPEDELKTGLIRTELIFFLKASLRRPRQLIIPLLSYQKW